MARGCGNNHVNCLDNTAYPIDNTTPQPCSIASWVYFVNGPGARECVFANEDSSTNPRLFVGVRATGHMFLYTGNYYNSSSSSSWSMGTWNHLAWTWAADNSINFYFNGSSAGTASQAAGGNAGSGGCTLMGVRQGGTYYGGFDLNGHLAEFATWDDYVLTAAEVASLHKGFSPMLVAPEFLTCYPKLFGTGNCVDHVLGTSWTETGTVTEEVHPRVIMPVPIQVGLAEAAAPPVGGHAGRLVNSIPLKTKVGGALVA